MTDHQELPPGVSSSEIQEPTLQHIVGAMLFAAKKPLTIADIRRVLQQVAEQLPEENRLPTRDAQIKTAVADVREALAKAGLGVTLGVAPGAGVDGGGYRLQTDPACGPWLRCLLEAGKPTRLSRPALETLAIIAYRQPATRAEIEGVRGVGVDAMLRTLLEMQLIKITGRSELPGRPLLYGTTQLFLEHFGLKNVQDLPGIDQLCRRDAERTPEAPAPDDSLTDQASPAPTADQSEPLSANSLQEASPAPEKPDTDSDDRPTSEEDYEDDDEYDDDDDDDEYDEEYDEDDDDDGQEDRNS
ncbi:MAG: SMC-Scp complex subunit ScpB [Kiritimatiellia bacterium]|jgi:segregation and condensation protein B